MTALLYYIEPDLMHLAMDTRTLEIDDETGDRSLGPFCSKLFLVPHLRGVICGTGLRSLPFLWHAFVQQRTVARDLAALDEAAADTLPQLAEESGLDAEITATIYHFGYSVKAQSFIARAFRSTNDFKAEELEMPALGIKPPDGMELSEALAICERMGLPDGFIEIMKKQKAIDDAKPSRERIGIGGEIQFLSMTPTEFVLRTCHRFDDHASDLAALESRGD